MRSAFISPANALTSGNLVCGFLGLILASQGEFGWAAGLVGLGAGLDAVDGIAARHGDRDDQGFGADLDSLADMLTFGAAPAMMLYLSLLHEIHIAGIAVCLGFVLCGAWRLARFPLVASPRRYVGLPIPLAGVTAAIVAAVAPPADLALVVATFLTMLMISEVPFPTLFPKRRARQQAGEVDLEEPQLAQK
ncbi:MAG: CDP-diacylglycerol--serine O-phosphatidyltransferase [Solirubrobacterales bacterium]|nr:CDP-diacylglycerol--serine O-phosphatidyltransferase [Thermoleophilaceae bacterium]MBA3862281.1 CDP-diacylglycerol--serine O-phosphatidyltransferase [Solirubrobacterales bacterium]